MRDGILVGMSRKEDQFLLCVRNGLKHAYKYSSGLMSKPTSIPVLAIKDRGCCDGSLFIYVDVHCMSRLEHMLCHGASLDVHILQCTAVFTDMLLEAPPSLADVHA